MKREEVFTLISEERDYQNIHNRLETDIDHSVADWIIYLETHLNKAKNECYKLNQFKSLCEIRKIAALAVACMENNQTPSRSRENEIKT